MGQAVEPHAKDITQQGLSQLSEFLRTGGVGSQIPAIRQARELAAGANRDSTRALEESLTASGLGSTPYAATARAENARAAGLATAGAESSALDRFLTAYLPQALRGPGEAAGAFLGVPNAPLALQAANALAGGQAAAAGYEAIGTGVGKLGGTFLNNYMQGRNTQANARTAVATGAYNVDAGGGNT